MGPAVDSRIKTPDVAPWQLNTTHRLSNDMLCSIMQYIYVYTIYMYIYISCSYTYEFTIAIMLG